MRKRAWGLVAASAIAGVACLFPDLGDLSGGGGDDAADVQNADVRLEAAIDAGPTDASFCKRADHSLCDDFDEQPLGALWTTQIVTSGALALVDAAFSPPSALSSIVSTATFGAAAYLSKDLIGPASRVRCEARVRVASIASGAVVTFQIMVTPASANVTGYTISLIQTATKTTFTEAIAYADGDGGGQSVDLVPSMLADAGAWTHMTFDADYASHLIAITFDGASVLSTGIVAPAGTKQNLRLGVQEYFGTLASMRYDDVACDVTP